MLIFEQHKQSLLLLVCFAGFLFEFTLAKYLIFYERQKKNNDNKKNPRVGGCK